MNAITPTEKKSSVVVLEDHPVLCDGLKQLISSQPDLACIAVADDVSGAKRLVQEWDALFDRFIAHYHLDDAQKSAAREKLQDFKRKTVDWLKRGPKMAKHLGPDGSQVEIEATPITRAREYQESLNEID